MSEGREDRPSKPMRRLALKRQLARTVLFAERAAPLLVPVLCVAAVFVSFGWLSLLRIVPDWLRLILLVGFVLAAIAALLPLRRLRWPSHGEAERFLEDRNGFSHQPIGVQQDAPAFETPLSAALWREHQARMARRIETIAVGAPKADLARHDRHGLRALPALLLFAAFGFSFSGSGGSVAEILRFGAVQSNAGLRVNAWATPPAYTGRPPVFLTNANAAAQTDTSFSLPQGSVLTVRVSGGKGQAPVFSPDNGEAVKLEADEAVQDRAAQGNPPSPAAAGQAQDGARSFIMELAESGRLDIGASGWHFEAVADRAPEIAFAGAPKTSVNGALEIGFTASDDYGLREAYAEIAPVEAPQAGAVPLYPAPEYRLDLPQRNSREVKGLTSRNLTDHPLAGKPVRITLIATDAAGQAGRSAVLETTLPARNFNEPLAAAVAEQRQVIALDARQVPRAVELNDALAIRPDETIPKLGHYLLIRSARERMGLARDEDELRGSADYLWEIALGIEDGDLSVAERRLREAERALDAALERGASDEEIANAMQELREAMDAYMNELARRMQNAPQQQGMQAQNMLRQRDLQNMMDQIENLARSGNRDAARQMLSDLQRLMNNLQAGRPRQGGQPGQQGDESPMRQEIDRLGTLMQEQQRLMDETFRLGQALRDRLDFGDPVPGENPQEGAEGQQQGQQQGLENMTAEQLRQRLRELRERQQGLGQSLGQLQEALKELGIDPGEGFGEAEREMGNAGRALGEADGERAAGAQGNAMNALRQGAESMIRQMVEAMQQQQGENGQGMAGGQQGGRDPLGRPRRDRGPDFGDSVKVPDEIDVQRARQILDAIRERLGNSPAGDIERQYLERLLDIR